MTTLIKTLPCENTRLFYVTDGRRIKLSDCEAEIQIYEELTDIPVLGANAKMKKYHTSLVICSEHKYTRQIDEKFLSSVDCFDLCTDIQREDGIFERINFSRPELCEITAKDEWHFDVTGQEDRLMKL